MSFIDDLFTPVNINQLPQSSVSDSPNKTGRSYSGCDIRAIVNSPNSSPNGTPAGSSPTIIGNISTLSYSIHREKYPARAMGSTLPRGYTRGPVTIAGTLIFSVFDKYALSDIAKFKARTDHLPGDQGTYMRGDQMTPFDISVMFQNEYGDTSKLALIGVELVDEGSVLSVNDIYIESTHSFVCSDIIPMYSTNNGPMIESSWVVPNLAYQFNTGTQTPVYMGNIGFGYL